MAPLEQVLESKICTEEPKKMTQVRKTSYISK